MSQKVFALRMALGGDRDVIPEGLKSDTVIIGWSKAPELLNLRDHDAQRAAINAAYGRGTQSAGMQARDVDCFLHQMSVGDLVLVVDQNGTDFYAACVNGRADYLEEHRQDDTAFRRAVVWLNSKRPIRKADVDPALSAELSGRSWHTCKDASQIADLALALLGDEDRNTLSQVAVDPGLTLYAEYERKGVHDIFSPDSAFTPGAGLWGMQGPIPINGRPGDYVFFVSFGRTQGGHEYEDGVTKDGVLVWESQPKQRLDDPPVKRWIEHDATKNSIYLFLRTKKGLPYTYLGLLKYLTHDQERQEPVYFQWQLRDGPVPEDVATRIGLEFLPADEPPDGDITPASGGLTLKERPEGQAKKGVTTAKFKGRKGIEYSELDAKNQKLGRAGERLVRDYERKRLADAGHEDLAAKVRHIAHEEGDGAGYDVLSFDANGMERYIEVKTTRGSEATAFFISRREVAFSEEHADRYIIYRLYEYDGKAGSASFYELPGAVSTTCNLEATQYRATRAKTR